MQINLASRQGSLELFERWDYRQLNAIEDGTFGLVVFPPGALIKPNPCEVIVDEAFVGPTTAQLVFTFDATGAAIATIDLLAAATTTVTVAGYYPEGIRIRMTVNKEGAVATAGVARLMAAYIVENRATETQTDVRLPS